MADPIVVCVSEAPPQHDQQCTDPHDCYCDVRRHEVIASEATRTIQQKETDHG